MQETIMQETDDQTSDADIIKYQVSLASAEAAGKRRNNAAKMSVPRQARPANHRNQCQ